MAAERTAAAVACTILLLLSAVASARPKSPPSARHSYARMIARADAIVLGRVLEAETREVPAPAGDGTVNDQDFARIAVQRWIVGPDRDSTLELRLGSHSHNWWALQLLQRAAPPSDRRVILYLMRSLGEWWMMGEPVYNPGHPAEGIEVLSEGDALNRIPSILHEAAVSSLDSLAARADLIVVGSLDFLHGTPDRACRVERVVSGTLTDSVLTIVARAPGDLRRGEALLMLAARFDSTWEVLGDGAGCYYLDQDRVAHSLAPLDTVLSRVAAARARRARGSGR